MMRQALFSDIICYSFASPDCTSLSVITSLRSLLRSFYASCLDNSNDRTVIMQSLLFSAGRIYFSITTSPYSYSLASIPNLSRLLRLHTYQRANSSTTTTLAINSAVDATSLLSPHHHILVSITAKLASRSLQFSLPAPLTILSLRTAINFLIPVRSYWLTTSHHLLLTNSY
jgi:hypothetical protein